MRYIICTYIHIWGEIYVYEMGFTCMSQTPNINVCSNIICLSLYGYWKFKEVKNEHVWGETIF
jgi:hypothetical protein